MIHIFFTFYIFIPGKEEAKYQKVPKGAKPWFMVEEETSMSLEVLHQVGCRKMQAVMQWWAGGRWKGTRSRGPASSIEINLAIELASQIDKLCHKCWACSRCRYSIFRGKSFRRGLSGDSQSAAIQDLGTKALLPCLNLTKH